MAHRVAQLHHFVRCCRPVVGEGAWRGQCRPTKSQMVINVKAAKAMGRELPAKLLALADEVMEQ